MKKYGSFFSILILFAAIFAACASIAAPSGGDYDFDPPKVTRAYPDFNSVNVTEGKITILFDENITLEKQSEKVIVTPPQKSFPIINTVNRKLHIQLKDSLIPNTTYTIDFTDAVVDNNEKNALENFSYSFSTGDVVDTLAISGKVLDAENLEPIKGIYVGLHSNLDDTTFTKVKFLRISRTNDYGLFTIKGIAPGRYKVYALDDANRDYMYDNPAEAVAFLDTIIEPAATRDSRMDTVSTKVGNVNIDSIKMIQYTRFIPDNIVLRSFKSAFKRQYLQKYERTENQLAFYFGAPTEMPKIEPINFEPTEDWFVMEKTKNNDTISYWIKDQKINAIDTLSFQMTYLKTDSLNNPVSVTDTLNLINRQRKDAKKKEKKEDKRKQAEEEEKIVFLEMTTNISSTWDVYKDISFEFKEPLTEDLTGKIKLQHLVDTTFRDIDFQITKDSLNPRLFTIKHKWKYSNEYKVMIDSAAIYGIYGLWNDKFEQKMKVRNEDEYGNIGLNITDTYADSIPRFVELLDKSDKPIRKAIVKDKVAIFKNLAPGEYYARIVYDVNGNGVWDTGEYNEKRQPEMVCYFEKTLTVRAFSDTEEDWTINVDNIDKQKPLEITKNKPQEKEKKQQQMENRDAKADRQEQQRRNRAEGNDINSGNNNTGNSSFRR